MNDSVNGPIACTLPTQSLGAYELKFIISQEQVADIIAWAEQQLKPDEHGAQYDVESVYTDTPAWSVLNRHKGYTRRKYRVRRYGASEHVYLEQKSKLSGRVSKRRSSVPLHELLALNQADSERLAQCWYARELQRKDLHPVCRIAYARQAYAAPTDEGFVRVTVDQQLRARPEQQFGFDHATDASASWQPLADDQAIVEMKFEKVLPSILKQLISQLEMTSVSHSKYRRAIKTLGLAVSIDEFKESLVDSPTIILPSGLGATG